MKRILFSITALLFLLPLMVVVFQMTNDPGSNQPGVAVTDVAEQVRRGKYLATAGNCMGCHTARGGKAYAGGRLIATQFGSFYTTNITPDRQTGIGTWTADDFWRAIHNGKSKDGSFLYPAFPYPNYTKVSRADADAIFAYIKTVAAVTQPNREHELRFPYNQRMLLAFWRALYFSPGMFEHQAGQTAEWNRGAYLVQGLGHCAACHTPRDALGGTLAGVDLAGGMIPMRNWYASSLASGPGTGLGEWDTKDIADYLKSGVSRKGAAFGPMAEVVGTSLQHLSQADVNAMAIYLKSVSRKDMGQNQHAAGTADRNSSGQAAGPIAIDAQAMLKQGARLYDQHCVDCHQADGSGRPPAYPPLAGNHSLWAGSPLNPIRMVLLGGYPPSTAGNPRPYGMPPFGFALNDDEVAAVVSYIRSSWGNQGTLVSPLDVRRSRGAPVE